MKKFSPIYFLSVMIIFSSCIKRDVLSKKDGASLPPVTSLALQELDSNRVFLSWGIPENIPENILRPLNVYIEVKEVVSSLKSLSIFNVTIPEDTRFEYAIPDPAKTYHITVKLNGMVNSTDPNFSNNIFSLGQTVIR
jgi:hypothetical protein